jgi:hypothetical protein
VTEQELVPLLGSVHVVEPKVPDALPLSKVTVPPGRIGVPARLASLTVAVQVLPALYVSGFGEQLTVVVLSRFEAVTLVWSLLTSWLLSPP